MASGEDLIAKFKRRPFAAGLLPLSAAMRSFATDFPRIYAKEDGAQRWVICDTKTKAPALFSHAAVVGQADPEETGNLVPNGKEVPNGLEAKNIQRRANSKCFYTYSFDTSNDLSLYEAQWTLDEYMGTVKGFNPGDLPRRAYLSGQDARFRGRFWMQTPMFVRQGSGAANSSDTNHLHTWVIATADDSSFYQANPDRPRVWVRDGDATVPLRDKEGGGLQRGDIAAMSCMVTYHVTNMHWFAQFHPLDVVLLKRSPWFGDAGNYGAPTIKLHARPPPSLAVDYDQSGDDGDDGLGQSVTKVLEGGPVSADTGEMEDVLQGEGAIQAGQALERGELEAMEVDDEAVPQETSAEGMGHTLVDGVEGDFEVVDRFGDDGFSVDGDERSDAEVLVDIEAKEEEVRKVGTRKSKGKGKHGRV